MIGPLSSSAPKIQTLAFKVLNQVLFVEHASSESGHLERAEAAVGRAAVLGRLLQFLVIRNWLEMRLYIPANFYSNIDYWDSEYACKSA